ncbi:MAG: molecular chaperone DnaJ [Candidatus Parabeggiatoa sp. nov. 3]|jgi:curved DNA-binding protein CbpA|nr:MAG: molecular chaperone DnaJ [Gammaproteobacteria bacterium]RKZ69280.1 MAG: molecular chaperone DnaJ [Gammaproteobacteria bacterium]RKZ86696.1 MAG: molecular chaperone DnaJ [Gammaproteobacteria bacterium]
MKTPFDLLGLPENATDEAIKKAYLQKVRQYPPERAPEQFQKIRAAFEAIKTQQQRLKYQLFHHEPPSLNALLEHAQQSGTPQRPTVELMTQALAESLNRPPK